MLNQIYEFKTDADPIFITKFGNGHINDTYLVVDATARQYILQKINKTVFHKPDEVMANVKAVLDYLKKNTNQRQKSLSLVPAKSGLDWHVDESGEYWRLYYFISDTICLQKAESFDDFKESGVAFGNFQNALADFPADTLYETILNFHDTPNRFKRFNEVLKADPQGRAKSAAREIEFALEREAYAGKLISLHEEGSIPLRVTHNDTKLTNVLFDRYTRKSVCVVDLDTVMPGLSVHDFGDSIRFGASTASEDETDLSKVQLSMELFKAYTSGYLSSSMETLTVAEFFHLRDGAKMMTLECGLRFLTDYLEGDVYFKVHRDGHNLDRCRTQFKLVEEMESKWDEMQKIIIAENNYGRK